MHYSNLGVGVLGPTDGHLTPAQRSRLVPGHRARGRSAPPWPLDAIPGAGALRSTAGDMLRYLSAQLHPDKTPLAEAIRLTQVVREEAGPMIGLGWIRLDKPQLLWWHNGGTGGYRSVAAFRPGRDDAVVVLSNQSRSVDRVGLRVLRALD